MGKRSSVLIICLIVVQLLIAPPSRVTGLDTGPSVTSSNITLPLKINLKLWGFEGSSLTVQANLINNLPDIFYHESISPKNSTPTQHKALIENQLLSHRSPIEYTIEEVRIQNENGIKFLEDNIASISESKIGPVTFPNGTTIGVSGLEIDQSQFSNLLQDYNAKEGITVHLLDLRYLIDLVPQGIHWYSLGDTDLSPFSNLDLRNLGLVGDRSLFYDPTAYAPLFEENVFDLNETSPLKMVDFMLPRAIQIIEEIVIGSPYSYNYLALRQDLHIAQVVVGDQLNDVFFNDAKSGLTNTLANSVNNLFPYFKMRYSYPSVLLNRHADVVSLLEEAELKSGVTGTINVDFDFSENFKNTIRRNTLIYDDFPIGWYYPIVFFADSNERDFAYTSDEGIVQYENQEIGFGIVNLKEWRNNINKDRISLNRMQLRVLGKMLGIHELIGFTAQIESAMSSYGVTENWNGLYTNFEVETLTRKYGALFNYTSWLGIRVFRDSFEESEFRWLDSSKLDDAEKTLIEGEIAYIKENYTQATELFIKGYNQWIDARDSINQKIINIKNSLNLVGLVIIMLYIINFLFSTTISKKKFLKQIKNKKVVEKSESDERNLSSS